MRCGLPISKSGTQPDELFWPRWVTEWKSRENTADQTRTFNFCLFFKPLQFQYVKFGFICDFHTGESLIIYIMIHTWSNEGLTTNFEGSSRCAFGFRARLHLWLFFVALQLTGSKRRPGPQQSGLHCLIAPLILFISSTPYDSLPCLGSCHWRE